MNRLRRGECWHASHLQIFPEEATPLEGVAGCSLDITCVLERCARVQPLPGCCSFAPVCPLPGRHLIILPFCMRDLPSIATAIQLNQLMNSSGATFSLQRGCDGGGHAAALVERGRGGRRGGAVRLGAGGP